MNNPGLLAGLIAVALLSGGLRAEDKIEKVISIEELFEIAEVNSVQLRPSFSSEDEARREISVARSRRLPDINTNLSISYIGDGFTTDRIFNDYQKATPLQSRNRTTNTYIDSAPGRRTIFCVNIYKGIIKLLVHLPPFFIKPPSPFVEIADHICCMNP